MAQASPTLVTEKPVSRPAWWIPAAILGVLTIYVYGPTLEGLMRQWWRDPNFSHGFLVPLFSGFVAWNNRSRLSRVTIRPSWTGLLLVIIALAMLLGGVLGAELFLARSSFIVLLAGLLVLFRGWSYFRALLFAWACLFLMVPIPVIVFNQVTLPLQLLASKLASNLLALLGVPVLRDGNILRIPAMSLEVAEACSGIRSLISLITLALIYGYFVESRLLPRTLLLAAAIPIAVAANGLRIVGTGLLVQYGDADLAEGFFHSFSGWLIFVISLLMLWGLHKIVRALRRT